MDPLINKRIKQVLKGDQSAYADIVSLYQQSLYQVPVRWIKLSIWVSIGMKKQLQSIKHVLLITAKKRPDGTESAIITSVLRKASAGVWRNCITNRQNAVNCIVP